jgi:hypothetical protein
MPGCVCSTALSESSHRPLVKNRLCVYNILNNGKTLKLKSWLGGEREGPMSLRGSKSKREDFNGTKAR